MEYPCQTLFLCCDRQTLRDVIEWQILSLAGELSKPENSSSAHTRIFLETFMAWTEMEDFSSVKMVFEHLKRA